MESLRQDVLSRLSTQAEQTEARRTQWLEQRYQEREARSIDREELQRAITRTAQRIQDLSQEVEALKARKELARRHVERGSHE